MQPLPVPPSRGRLSERLSGRWLVASLIIGLLGVVVVELGFDFWESVARYRQAQRTSRTEMVISHLVKGAQHLAFERGRTNVVLHTATPIDEANRRFLEERRAQVAREFDLAIQVLETDNPEMARKLTRQLQYLAGLRRHADRELALPLDMRDATFADQWFASLSAMLTSVPESLFRPNDGLPLLARLVWQGFDLRNAMGMEASRMAVFLVVGHPPSPDQLSEIVRLRGEGDAAWANMRREVAAAGRPILAETFARATQVLHSRFLPLQDAVLHAFAQGRMPGDLSAAYLEASVPALDAVAAIMTVAAEEDLHLTQRAERQAWRGMWLYAGLMVLVLAIAVTVLSLVGAVMRSTQSLRHYFGDLAEGRLDQAPPARVVGYELTELLHIAASLRRSLQERRRMDAELRALSQQNRLILDNAADGLIALGESGQTVFANPAALRLTGWSLAEMEGRSHHDLIHHTRGDGTPNPAEICPVQQTLADGVARHVEDDLFWRKDGTSFPVELTVSAWDEEGQRGAVMVFRDISERRKAEEDNRRLLEELRASNTDLENFAYAVSHDLQAPLRTVLSFLTLTRRALADRLDETTTEYMDFASEGAKRMNDMIGALLSYARVGTRGQPPRPTVVAQAMEAVLTDLAPLIADSGGDVVIEGTLPMVMADPAQLNSVLQNLVANALKYRAPGRPPHVRVAGGRQGGMAVITVTDNGPGIPDDQKEVLFGLFKRGVGQDGPEGLGMGLAICRRILERLNGTIRVEDAPGGGARFVITLPHAGGLV